MLDGLVLTFQGMRVVLPCGRADCRNMTPSFSVTPIVAWWKAVPLTWSICSPMSAALLDQRGHPGADGAARQPGQPGQLGPAQALVPGEHVEQLVPGAPTPGRQRLGGGVGGQAGWRIGRWIGRQVGQRLGLIRRPEH